ncbi:putative Oxoglutarate dehydrogenase [Conidiobolus coronatus NRRL 28638]|uniref:2-oxoglutarate dehydrogenase, mitochondrial n=1 Tax=Conidiobolus coronatus (strain ATCC 28846 / CBS 209.66 / NRRL 28638) TaxID=796925 RepID=A0A137P3R7_CONC2|nr:putative Oxoglutarate dehydrogenase [Conidiobolus coronatus NRRL 28638]|eukprot:KXN69658.1 putative Oxoglutarate dehydrogenase [Conidiobolus coronatus NRRL 28638]
MLLTYRSLSKAISNSALRNTSRLATSHFRLKHASAVGNPIPHGDANFSYPQESFLSQASYVEQMFESWKEDPNSVHLSWRIYFQNMNEGTFPAVQFPPTLVHNSASLPVSLGSKTQNSKSLEWNPLYLKGIQVQQAFMAHGHRIAQVDPLKLRAQDMPQELSLSSFDITESDLNTKIPLGPQLFPHLFHSGIKELSLGDFIERLKHVYCGNVGYEFSEVLDPNARAWLQSKIETFIDSPLTKEESTKVLKQLIEADQFEATFAEKFKTVKRYGLEGAESMIPALHAIIDSSRQSGVKDVVIGMPHRGRLNTLVNIFQYPARDILTEFSYKAQPFHPLSGDNAYHLSRKTQLDDQLAVHLMANPSHLEAVHPIALGQVRALQAQDKDKSLNSAVGIIIHGDAAVSGQGVVYEAMNLHKLRAYGTGGSVHMVVNNQIGFTTYPTNSRSTPYCTDLFKMLNIPIFHVNGDDAEAVVKVSKLATEYRNTFHTDVMIDLWCYRKNGHNEVDQPRFTQPNMYKKVDTNKPVLSQYIDKLTSEGTLSKEEIGNMKQAELNRMEEAYQKSQGYQPKAVRWEESEYPGFPSIKEVFTTPIKSEPTGASLDKLRLAGKALTDLPSDFKLHSNLAKVIKARENMITSESNIDWATAEGLAYGTLLLDNVSVRISGQDVERGTFSQRHAAVYDQVSERRHIPLEMLKQHTESKFEPCSSHLSEFGTMGFELGYSLPYANQLTLWEAQFGDFANNAQCILDQFLVSGEQKWLQTTNLSILLPHGFDGNGPEHSSARIERYLQLSDDNPNVFPEDHTLYKNQINWRVTSCSTAANFFHSLRRQGLSKIRKPLISFNGKSILRHPLAKCSLSDLADGTEFMPVIPDVETQGVQSDIHKHIICTGGVYYQLLKTKQINNLSGIAITRLEELCPFPYQELEREISRYPNAQLTWVQEEPMNMGAWDYVGARVNTTLKHMKENGNGDVVQNINVISRDTSGAVATGFKKRHQREFYGLLSRALIDKAVETPSEIVEGLPVF